MHIIFQTLTNAVKLILLKWTNVIRVPLVLILRAHTNAFVIPHSLGMVLNAKVCLLSQKLLKWLVLIVKVRLFSAMPLFFLKLRLDRLLTHFSHIFKSVVIYVNYFSCIFNTRLCWYCVRMNVVTCQPSTRCLREMKSWNAFKVVCLLTLSPSVMSRGDLWFVWHGKIKMIIEIWKGTQFYSDFIAGRNCLASPCRFPKKNYFDVSLHHPLRSHQGSSLAAQMKIKYAEEYSIRQVVEIFKD